MEFGYTVLDPVLVVLASIYVVFILIRRPKRLILLLPALLTVYVFIPFITLLRLSDIVPSLMVMILLLRGRLPVFPRARVWILILCLLASIQLIYAIAEGDTEITPILIRSLYYMGLLALFLFSWSACRDEQCYRWLIRGAAIVALVHAVYGIYQLIAIKTGLPFRGIVRGTEGVQIAFEGGAFRINGLASEPKRLGYVLAIGAYAYYELARHEGHVLQKRLRLTGIGILGVSLLTFSGSYFLAFFIAGLALLILQPQHLRHVIWPVLLLPVMALIFSDATLNLWQDIQKGVERRNDEVEVGLNSRRVYRQEFYAQEYLSNNPTSMLTGVGIARSNNVLYSEFGEGAGYSEGFLLPLNSAFLQTIFDLGGPATLIIYGSLLWLIIRAWRRHEIFLVQALLFLGVQSLSIVVLQYLVVFMGAAFARLGASSLKNKGHRAIGGDRDVFQATRRTGAGRFVGG